MKTRLFVASLLPVVLTILVLGLTGGVTAQENQPFEKPKMDLIADMTLLSISPSNFASGVNQPVTIIGIDLSNVSSALLGDTALLNVHVTSATEVTAMVPWSIAAGTYDLTVKSEGELDAVLPSAVTISSANNDWVSNGPFGGELYAVVLDPVDPTHMYVSANRSGFWRSQDAGANWAFSYISPFPRRVQIAYPTIGQPPVMYLAGCCNAGLLRSQDYGQTWVTKSPSNLRGISDAFARPGEPNSIYVVLNGGSPSDGMYKSPNSGESWGIVNGTSGIPVSSVAFDPAHPDLNMVIGTTDGKVYITSDNGLTWSSPIAVSASSIGQLYFAPNLYNGKRALFAIPCTSDGDCSDQDISYQSLDGGLTWTILNVAPTRDNPHGLVYGLAFHDSIPGLIWAAAGDGYYSIDGGATWNPLGVGLHNINSFAVLPGAISRQATTLFAATREGLFKSTDGGDTWQENDNRLGGVLARAIAISPFNADDAYAATQSKGLQHTFDGGRHWQSLPIPIGGYDPGMATDPFTDGKVYFGNVNSGLPPTVRVSNDHGNSFTEYALPLPTEYAGWNADVLAIAPDPQTQGHLLAGVCLGTGLIYASTNSGLTWIQQTTPADMKCVSRLTFDPNDPDVVYAGSSGYGLLRSTDGGATWTPMANQPTTGSFMSIEIDPRNSNSIYLAVFARDPVPGGIFATHDGGETWVQMTGTGGPDWALKFVKVGTDYWLYAATMNGLQYLRIIPDDPTSPWERASGIAGVATVDGFNAATEDGRVVYYIGTSGGTVSTSSDASRLLAASTGSQNMAGGIYRSMVRINLVYLPFVIR